MTDVHSIYLIDWDELCAMLVTFWQIICRHCRKLNKYIKGDLIKFSILLRLFSFYLKYSSN